MFSFKILGPVVLMAATLSPVLATAHSHQEHSHAHAPAKAHTHGSGRLDLSFDGQKGEMDLDISAEVVLGSEKAPKTEAARTAENEKLKNFENHIKESIRLVGADCTWTKTEVKVDRHRHGKSEHADVEFEGELQCTKPLKGSTLQVGLFSHYPQLKKIEAQILTSDLQKGHSFDIKNTELQF